ncbi:hypothetical protein FDUTEX481_03154 [Tolypothrix sp. PCC 7601]|nr:hypothetical protein FDUTEX481_03154 [Tolypothrix sp. PCC 7601]
MHNIPVLPLQVLKQEHGDRKTKQSHLINNFYKLWLSSLNLVC